MRAQLPQTMLKALATVATRANTNAVRGLIIGSEPGRCCPPHIGYDCVDSCNKGIEVFVDGYAGSLLSSSWTQAIMSEPSAVQLAPRGILLTNRT